MKLTEKPTERQSRTPGREEPAGRPAEEGRPTPDTNRRRMIAIATMAALLSLLLNISQNSGDDHTEIPLSEALQLVEAGSIARAETSDRLFQVTLHPKDETQPPVVASYSAAYGEALIGKLLDAGVEVETQPVQRPSALTALISSLLPVAIIVAVLLLLMRRGGGTLGIGKLGRGRGEPVRPPDVRLSDVAGCQEAIEELGEVIEYLRNPERYTAAGAALPRGYLLVGPPGTGKTLLARAVAGEAGVPFFAVSGSEFVEVFVGQGAGRVRDLFERARRHPAAIVFIDEIDAVGRARGPNSATGAHIESENTLNQLLTEMDGFARTNIIVLAATNRADMLDRALTRAGRFDRTIQVPAPDRAGRTALLELHSRNLTLGADVDLVDLARRCPGMTGADLANLTNRAALEAARRHTAGDRTKVSPVADRPAGGRTEPQETEPQEAEANEARRIEVRAADFDSALATLMLGRERTSAVLTPRDRTITAWHEAGHAVAALLDKDAADPAAVSIIPRGQTGGATWLGGAEHQMATRDELLSRMRVAMAGRAGETIGMDGQYTAGAHGDLQVATGIAEAMVHQWGMSEGVLKVSEPTQIRLSERDEAVEKLLGEALRQAEELLGRNRQLLRATAELLLEHETISGEQLRQLAEQQQIQLPDKQELMQEPRPIGRVAAA